MFKVVVVEVFTATDEVEPTMEGHLDLEGKGVSASCIQGLQSKIIGNFCVITTFLPVRFFAPSHHWNVF
jgi:hypothetical protein